jgi:hypothetical protein
VRHEIEIQVAPLDGKGRGWRESHIAFTVEKTKGTRANKATVEIKNLSLDSVRYIESAQFARLLVDGMQLYVGEIRRKTLATNQQSADRVTRFECGHALAAVAAARVDLSYAPGTPRSVAVQAAAAALGLGLRAPPVDLGVFSAGFAYSGRAAAVLDAVAPGWTVLEGVLDWGGGARKMLRLASGLGLLGNPERRDGETKARCLLNPAILPHDVVELQSKVVTGTYRAAEVTHKGDSRGDTWETGLTLESYP